MSTTRMQQRRSLASEWTSINPVLAAGEIGFETDTNKFKIGNGTGTWSQLTYFASTQAIQDLIDGAPDLLNTLNEIAAAIGDDPNFIATINAAVDAEEAARILADSGLNTRLTTAEADIDTLQSGLAQEILDRDIAIEASVANLVNAAPDTLNTLQELATAIGNDATFIDTFNLEIADVRADGQAYTDASVDAERTFLLGYVDQQVAAEEQIRMLEDQTISDTLDAHIASNIIDLGQINTDIAAIDLSITTIDGAILGINDQIDITNSNLATEILDRQTAIESAIAQEVIARDGAIETAIDLSEIATLATAATDAQTKANAALAAAELSIVAHNSETLNVHGIADTSELSTQTYVNNAVATHEADTINVHGIPDTSQLATLTDVSNAVITHEVDTLGVHGIADTAELELKSGATTKANAAYSNAVAYTDTEVAAALVTAATSATAYTDSEITDLNTSAVSNNTANAIVRRDATGGFVAGQIDSSKLVLADGTGTHLNIQVDGVSGGATIVAPTGDISLAAQTGQVVIGGAEVTTETNAQILTNKIIDTADNDITIVASDISDVTATATELNYVDGVTSSIQTQLDSKAPSNSPTLTGSVNITGDLTVSGTTTTVNATNLNITDPLIYIGEGNAANISDLGLVASFDDGTYQHTGLVRDATDGKWKLFSGVIAEPGTTVDLTAATYDTLKAGTFEGSLTGNAATATKFANPVNINGVPFDGSVDVTVSADITASNLSGTTLASNVVTSSLTTVGSLTSLDVVGDADISGDLTVLGNIAIATEPTIAGHAATKAYVDAAVAFGLPEIQILDDISNHFDGITSRFFPKYLGQDLTLRNPFNLLLTIDGIIQSVGFPDYVWQSPLSRKGFRIDNDGYLAFPEAVKPGATFECRVLLGPATTTKTKVYPFKATEILLGG